MLKTLKTNIRLLILLLLVVGVLIGMEVNNNIIIGHNQFGVTKNDDFTISFWGETENYMITDFSTNEKMPILRFIASLENPSAIEEKAYSKEIAVNYPLKITAYQVDSKVAILIHNVSYVEVRTLEKDGTVKSIEKYETSQKALKKMYAQVGITGAESLLVTEKNDSI